MSHTEFPATTAAGYQQFALPTNAGPAVPLPSIPVDEYNTPVRRAFIQCQVATARVRIDGTNPTANIGYAILKGETIELMGDAVGKARFISDTATASVLSVQYFIS